MAAFNSSISINGATEPWPVSGEHFSIKNLILKNGRFTKIALSHWQSQSPLTQGWRYRAARDLEWLYFISELIFNGRLRPVNWSTVVLEDDVLWWNVFGNNWTHFSNISWYPWALRFPSTNAKVSTPLYEIHFPRSLLQGSVFMHSSFHSSLAFLQM